MKTISWKEKHIRIHPATFTQLKVHKYHTELSMNDIINILLKEALENEYIKQKILSMYQPGVSTYIINDWRERYD